MAKKDNTIYYVAGLAVLGGGYYAYKKGLFDKVLGKKPAPLTSAQSGTSTTSALAIENKAGAIVTQAERRANPLTDPNSYESKVAYIQSKIAATPDGVAGKETNRLFDATYGFDKGAFSPLNIDYYVNRVKNNNTKAQIAALNQKAAAASAGTAKVVSDFKVAYNKGFRSWGLSQSYSASQFLRDGVTGALKPTGKKVSFANGDLRLRDGSSLTGVPYGSPVFGSASVSVTFDGGKTYYAFPPAILLLNK